MSQSPDTVLGVDGLSALSSSKTLHKLNLIDQIRSNGIGDHISLPQLVVCGDQSSGKSSVLTGLTGIPFPRRDGACTRFATEIILRHSTEALRIVATILPHQRTDGPYVQRMKEFKHQLSNFAELPHVIDLAAEVMEVGNPVESKKTHTFTRDVLRLEVVGPTGLHLTIVDVPGLIAVDESDESNVELISELVNSYLKNSRTIILAVIQAGNDIQNQSIIQRARKYDHDGLRTIGIITKPDLINAGTEDRIARLSRNEDTTKLRLGFFIVKNPSPSEMTIMETSDQRSACEAQFFESEVWRRNDLDMHRVGVDRLKAFVGPLLHNHIEKELPRVRTEVEDMLRKTEVQLSKLGEERPTAMHKRSYLIRTAMNFQNLVKSALDGTYHGENWDFFQCAGYKWLRLRAEIHDINTEFATQMRENSRKRIIQNADASNGSKNDAPVSRSRIVMTQKAYNKWVKEIYLSTRGRELPGSPNHMLISELFRQESCLWQEISTRFVTRLCKLTVDFSIHAIDHIVKDEPVRKHLHAIIDEALQKKTNAAHNELTKILQDEANHPITYNHYYTDNLQHARDSALEKTVRVALTNAISSDWNGKLHISNTPNDLEKLMTSLKKRITVNMDDQACSEAILSLDAYYKVAMKTFVDNVCRQVAERHLFGQLPDILGLDYINQLSDSELSNIAAEPEEKRLHREEKTVLAQGLRDSLKALQKSYV